jgi:hypothetical protein
LVKTHTGKTSSLRPVGCISDQLPARRTVTTSLRLAREVFASHDKSSPRMTSLRLAQRDWLRLVRGHGRAVEAHDASTTTDAHEERFPTPCKYNSWRPCKRLTPTRALMLA